MMLITYYVFVIDLHVCPGCSSGYSLAKYPLLSQVNSQINEQANAGLQRIKDQLSYMTADNFVKHCSFFLWNKNNLKRQLLD